MLAGRPPGGAELVEARKKASWVCWKGAQELSRRLEASKKEVGTEFHQVEDEGRSG